MLSLCLLGLAQVQSADEVDTIHEKGKRVLLEVEPASAPSEHIIMLGDQRKGQVADRRALVPGHDARLSIGHPMVGCIQ